MQDKYKFNYGMLIDRIKDMYESQNKFASKMGVSRSSLSSKLNNHISFSQTDIKVITDLLQLDPDEVYTYFFTSKVVKTQQKPIEYL